MNTQLRNAIDSSVRTNTIVTVNIDSESDMQKAFEELVSDVSVAEFDYTDATATLREVWGTTIDGSQWRVHLMQSERMKMIIYVYSNETGRQVDAIEGRDNTDCEQLAGDIWSSNDYHWSYINVEVSNVGDSK